MSKVDYLNYDDVREDRRQQKKFKKRKSFINTNASMF